MTSRKDAKIAKEEARKTIGKNFSIFLPAVLYTLKGMNVLARDFPGLSQ